MTEGRKYKSAAAAFTEVLSAFKNPPLRFRPFQMIHDFSYLQRAGLCPEEVVELLVERGFGGAVTNTAWEEYLTSDNEWKILRHGVRLLLEKGLGVWLYDEKGYPSGTAGEKIFEGHPEWEAIGVFCVARKVGADQQVAIALPSFALEWVHCTAYPLVGTMIQPSEIARIPCGKNEPIRWTAPRGKWLFLAFATKKLFKGTMAANNNWVKTAYVNLLTPEATDAFCKIDSPGLCGAPV